MSVEWRKGPDRATAVMLSLLFGLTAALCWGVHDVLVRHVTQHTGIVPTMASVVVSGTVFLLPFTLWHSDWSLMSRDAVITAAMAGGFYVMAGYALYQAFAIGPVRLVAPVIGAYPILSVAAAAFQGQAVEYGQWLALLAIVAGVGLVATLSDEQENAGTPQRAIGWAALSALGYALAFGTGQAASQMGDEMATTVITRLTAVLAVACLLAVMRSDLRQIRGRWRVLIAMGALDATALGLVMGAGALPNPTFAIVAASTFGMITIILAWAFLSERMQAGQWAAVMLAFAGIGYLAL